MEQNENDLRQAAKEDQWEQLSRANRIAAQVPETVVGDQARALYITCNAIRTYIKDVASETDKLRKNAGAVVGLSLGGISNTEVVANATLAYRHLEDASMRLGKMLQALDGGVSVYDKATTVGA